MGVLQKLHQDLVDYKPAEILDNKVSRLNGSVVSLCALLMVVGLVQLSFTEQRTRIPSCYRPKWIIPMVDTVIGIFMIGAMWVAARQC